MKAGSSKGNEWQYGFGVTYNQSNSSYTLGFTHYGGDDAQTNWYASYHNGDFSFSMTNDAFLNIVNGNSSDKYRTAGIILMGLIHMGKEFIVPFILE